MGALAQETMKYTIIRGYRKTGAIGEYTKEAMTVFVPTEYEAVKRCETIMRRRGYEPEHGWEVQK